MPTAEYIAGSKDAGNRESDYFLLVKGNHPALQRAEARTTASTLGAARSAARIPGGGAPGIS